MGISRSYLLLFCAVVALLGLAVLAITTGVLVYPITRPIPAWYVYAAGYFISITLLIFAPLGVSRSSTFKASRKGVSGVLLIAVIYAGLTVLTGLWLSSWAHDFFEVRREGFDSRTLSKPAMAIVQEIEKDFTSVYKNADCRSGGQTSGRFDGIFSPVRCDHDLTKKALNAAATFPEVNQESGREYLMCLAFPRQQVADVKGVTGLWCRTGKVVVNNIAKITLWLAIIMFALALLFLLPAVAAWRQKRKGIREQVPQGFGETAPLMIAGTRLTYA
ncbi:hypothetical protein FOZ63_001307 [Perkinsus olseni]|uniref:Uncharacterized protein n=1 Tax=Perkinsus olseni TaxID=32597 RepID=A0A7J6QXT2_PEROL|nr:hypothetical protein FOZ63_001307 [Perkinsus olseni]